MEPQGRQSRSGCLKRCRNPVDTHAAGFSGAAPARVSRPNLPAESHGDGRFSRAARAAIGYTQSRSAAIMGGSKLGVVIPRHAIGGADCSLGKGGGTPPVASHPIAAARQRRAIRPGTPTRVWHPRPALGGRACLTPWNTSPKPPRQHWRRILFICRRHSILRSRQGINGAAAARNGSATKAQCWSLFCRRSGQPSEEKAATAGLSMAAYARACMLGNAGPRARKRPPVNTEVSVRSRDSGG